ncbi:MAG: hypothetical protein ABI220_05460 [Candidatus Saccharimonadales bacterium]
MADFATKQDVEEIVGRRVDKAVADLSEVIAQFGNRIDERFNQLELRVDKLEEQFDRLNNTLDAFLKRLSDIEADNSARDAQIARLERWIETVAQKAGVKLEY